MGVNFFNRSPRRGFAGLIGLTGLALSFALQGCVVWSVAYHSVPADTTYPVDNKVNAIIPVGGTVLFVNPVNSYTKSDTAMFFLVPVLHLHTKAFSSGYYPTPLLKGTPPPKHFIMELLVEPQGHDVSLDLSTVRVTVGQQSYSPMDYWATEAGGDDNTFSSREFSMQERLRHVLCRNFGAYYHGTEKSPPTAVAAQVVKLDPLKHACFILRFGTQPIHPKNQFLVEIEDIRIDGQRQPPTRTSFVPLRKSSSEGGDIPSPWFII